MLIGSTRKRELEEGLRSLEEWYRSVSKKILDERSLGSSSQTTQAILNDLIGKLDDVKNKRQVGNPVFVRFLLMIKSGSS